MAPKRSYARDIGYASLGLGSLMSVAALGAITVSALMPKGELPPFPGAMAWLFAHPLLTGLVQLAQGAWVLLSARAYLRGKPGGRVVLRLALALVTVEWIVFSIVWISGIGAFFAQMPEPSPIPSTFFSVVAVLSSLSFIVPLILAVWYLGRPAALSYPRERVV
jgi:F0F1-type ATP synthase membrane subunit a